MVAEREQYGTAEADRLTAISDGVTYGLAGDDGIDAIPGDGLRWLVGGLGDDRYVFTAGTQAVLFDPDADLGTTPNGAVGNAEAGGSGEADTAVFDGFSLLSGTVELVEIDGRHVVFLDSATDTSVLWLDFRTSSVDTLIFEDTLVERDFLAIALPLVPGFVETPVPDPLADLALTPVMVDEAIAQITAREAALLVDPPPPARIDPAPLPEMVEETALLYEAAFDRDGVIDAAGLNYWIDAREGGLGLEALAALFLTSAEFTEAFGLVDALEDSAFIARLYRNVLDRAGDPAGITHWAGMLAEGMPREEALIVFALSPEHREGAAVLDTIVEGAPGEWLVG
ncbi:MAG: DUF4214 domain-containing protein [Pseudomonadota bacterium]